MRQIDFLMVFALCMALMMFSMVNTERAKVQRVQGMQVQTPISIELILAMGVSAVIAWFFSIWKLQSFLKALPS